MDSESLTQAVEDVVRVFERHTVTYALIGGLAVSVRGRVRTTKDADFIIQCPALSFPGVLSDLVDVGFEIDVGDTIRRWPVEKFTAFYRGPVRIDWMQPVLPLYAAVVRLAEPCPWGEGKTIRIATAEGLILTKLTAFRLQDQIDITALLAANRDTLDLSLIQQEWSALSTVFPERWGWLEKEFAGVQDV